MKNLWLIFLLFVLMSFRQDSRYKLTISTDGFKEIKGVLEIGLFNKEQGFLKTNSRIRFIRIPVNEPVVSYTFAGLPAGYYAVSLYHDVNSDKKCNRNMLGIPKESYGFSNNFKPFLSTPDFDDAKFYLNSDTTITIHLIH